MQNRPEFTVWINGEFVPERQAKISVFDNGFVRGDAVFDAARTFNGRLFQAEEHLDRLMRSCQFLQLEPPLSREEILRVTHEVTERNRGLIPEVGDFWVIQQVTRGIDRPGFTKGCGLIISATALPLRERAPFYRDGLPIAIPSVRRTPPWAVSPRAKTHNYINFTLAQQEVQRVAPGSWAVLLDENGNLAEGHGSNLFLVKNGELLTPEERYVLPGISRATVLRLARDLGIPTRESSLDLYDARTADEIFLTSTSLCLCGVSSVNGVKTGSAFPGPVTRRLQKAYNELCGMDFVAQYLEHLEK